MKGLLGLLELLGIPFLGGGLPWCLADLDIDLQFPKMTFPGVIGLDHVKLANIFSRLTRGFGPDLTEPWLPTYTRKRAQPGEAEAIFAKRFSPGFQAVLLQADFLLNNP